MNDDTDILAARRKLFFHLENTETVPDFFRHVADDVRWTLLGRHPLAGVYRSKAAFLEGPVARVDAALRDGLRLTVDHLYVAGPVTVAEMRTAAVALDGFPYEQIHAWICRFEDDTLVEARSYVDSVELTDLLRRTAGPR